MISLIDIFQPRDTGLPDISRISPAQIFNGSAAASLEAMKQKYDPQYDPGYRVQRPVEVRRARVVEEVLNGSFAVERGHKRGSLGSRSGGYDVVEPMDSLPDSGEGNILNNDLNKPGPVTKDHNLFPANQPLPPPMPGAKDISENSSTPPNLDEEPVDEFKPLDYLKRLPKTILSELHNLNLLPQ